ncbi:hypothetical protein ACH5RR_008975 [Cinchona calisaya]|uniref:Aminotransferase-like plant mobile domain-containing protein n=1 Tax=Cinchona calisaya TaxID=153742 RepID=A0ABD3AI07_9GENT
MLTFRKHIVRGKKYLVILNDENELLLDGTMLPVHTPLHGAFFDTWGALANPYYVKEWTMKLNSRQSDVLNPHRLLSILHSGLSSTDSFTTLAREILSGTAHWFSKLKFGGEFSPICGYWDWTMEILGNNENKLVKGFPNPTSKTWESRKISIAQWIEFWYRGAINHEFKKTSMRKSLGHPRSTHNPSGHYEVRRVRKPVEEGAFVNLGLNTWLWDETYLTAFLSCWLCAFVLPNDEVNLICLTTFKAATWMA